jgi:hypothetical protein
MDVLMRIGVMEVIAREFADMAVGDVEPVIKAAQMLERQGDIKHSVAAYVVTSLRKLLAKEKAIAAENKKKQEQHAEAYTSGRYAAWINRERPES